MPIQKPNEKEQGRIDAHWAKVRAGLYKSDEHIFKDDISHLIELERFKAQKCIEAAAAHMRHANELCEVV